MLLPFTRLSRGGLRYEARGVTTQGAGASGASEHLAKSPAPETGLEIEPRARRTFRTMRELLRLIGCVLAMAFAIDRASAASTATPFQISGIYPHLAMFNEE